MSKRVVALVSGAAAFSVAAILGCVQSVVWHGADAPAAATFVATRLAPAWMGQAAASGAFQPAPAYFGVGRFAIAAYLLLAVAATFSELPLSARARRVTMAAGVLAATGDVLAYWVSAAAGPTVRRVGFWYLELPALAVAAVVLTVAGIGALRSRRAGGEIALALPVAVATTATLRYLPHGILVGFGVALFATAVRGGGGVQSRDAMTADRGARRRWAART